MTTNELKKGDRIMLKCGWYATMLDNKRGGIRLAEVEGIEKEIGSIYSGDIAYKINADNTIESVEMTASQRRQEDVLSELIF
jgi:hypothetical protein